MHDTKHVFRIYTRNRGLSVLLATTCWPVSERLRHQLHIEVRPQRVKLPYFNIRHIYSFTSMLSIWVKLIFISPVKTYMLLFCFQRTVVNPQSENKCLNLVIYTLHLTYKFECCKIHFNYHNFWTFQLLVINIRFQYFFKQNQDTVISNKISFVLINSMPYQTVIEIIQ